MDGVTSADDHPTSTAYPTRLRASEAPNQNLSEMTTAGGFQKDDTRFPQVVHNVYNPVYNPVYNYYYGNREPSQKPEKSVATAEEVFTVLNVQIQSHDVSVKNAIVTLLGKFG